MLPEINLDNDKFSEMVSEGRNMIASIYPEWTDYNYHDPGITFIELFSWLREIQQYSLNYIGDRNYYKYLKLLGMSIKHKKGSKVDVVCKSSKDMIMPKKARMWAGKVSFETESSKYIVSDDISKCFSVNGIKIELSVDRNLMNSGYNLKKDMFLSKNGTKFFICFDNSLPKDIDLDIFFELFEGYPVKRNKVKEKHNFSKLAKIKFEYYTSYGWTEIEELRDETYGFVQSGHIYFKLKKNMRKYKAYKQNCYAMRFTLLDNEYDVYPKFNNISMNVVSVRQRDTVIECIDLEPDVNGPGDYIIDSERAICSEDIEIYEKYGEKYIKIDDFETDPQEDYLFIHIDHLNKKKLRSVRVVVKDLGGSRSNVLAVGNGMPFQEYDLPFMNTEYNLIKIMVEESEDRYVEWTLVDDFDGSSKYDKHFVLDVQRGKVMFGNCIKGMAPTGKIILVQNVLCLGEDGNININKINKFDRDIYSDIQVTNNRGAHGGRDEETIEECFLRARKNLKKVDSLVAYEDYEQAVKRVPGLMIENCKAINTEYMRKQGEPIDGNTVFIAIKPFSEEGHSKLTDKYIENIKSFLRPNVLIGTTLKLLSPIYIEIGIFAEVKVKSNYLNDETEIIKELEKFFKNEYSSNFGKMVSYNDVYGIIDRLPFVRVLGSLTIEARGNGIKRTPNGDVVLPANGIIIPKDIEYSISISF